MGERSSDDNEYPEPITNKPVPEDLDGSTLRQYAGELGDDGAFCAAYRDFKRPGRSARQVRPRRIGHNGAEEQRLSRRQQRILLIGGSVVLAGIFAWTATETDTPQFPETSTHAAAVTAGLSDAGILKQLGVCGAELRAESQMERWRFERKRGTRYGLTEQRYLDAARFAESHAVSCEPPAGALRFLITQVDGQEVTLQASALTTFDQPYICKTIMDDKRLREQNADKNALRVAEYTQHLQIAERLADDAGIQC